MADQLDLVRILNKRAERHRFYRRHRDRLLQYHRRHHFQWRKTKRFARAAGMPLDDARRLIARRLAKWFAARGIVVRSPGKEK